MYKLCGPPEGLRLTSAHAKLFLEAFDAMESLVFHKDQKTICALWLAIVAEAHTCISQCWLSERDKVPSPPPPPLKRNGRRFSFSNILVFKGQGVCSRAQPTQQMRTEYHVTRSAPAAVRARSDDLIVAL